MVYKKGLTGEAVTDILFWIVFFVVTLTITIFLIKKFA